MKRHFATLLAAMAVIAALLSTGCTKSDVPSAPSQPPGSARSAANSPYVLTIVSPAHSKQLTNALFGVRLARRAGNRPVTGATVSIALSMPSMVMPTQEVSCTEERPGYYSGAGTFTMGGDWRVEAAARIKGRKIAMATSWVRVE